MSRDRDTSRATNAQIITTDTGRDLRPANLLNAISEIQQFFVIEGKGQEIPAEFLTLERTLDFFKIGIRSGFHEGLVLIFLFPLFSFYLFPFVFKGLDRTSHLLFGCIPYLVLLVNTLMCSYISRYYVGNITRKAINALLAGRTMALLIKSFLLYAAYLLLFRVSTPANVWKAASWFGARAERIYSGFLAVKPHLVPAATESSLLMVVAALFPYGSVYLLDLWQRYRLRRTTAALSG